MILMTDLNGHSTLFGGQLMAWCDLAASMYCGQYMGKCVTVKADAIEFKVPGHLRDILTFHVEETKRGRTSMTVKVTVIKNETSDNIEMASSSFTFVGVDDNGKASSDWNKQSL